jgi:bifunctional non-homologous end joining protein LigD
MQIQKQVRLLFNDLNIGGRSDKEYALQLLSDGSRAAVAAQYGRRGAALTIGYLTSGAGWSKTVVVMTPAQAQAAYDRKLNEKLSDGYVADSPAAPASPASSPTEVSTASSGVENAGEPPCELLTEIDERAALLLVEDKNYWMQKKENGRRLEIRKRGSRVDGINRKGKIVPLPPALATEAQSLPLDSFLTDGEAISEQAIAFDLLEADGDLREKPYWFRFSELLAILARAEDNGKAGHIRPVQTWFTVEDKRKGLAFLRASRSEGAVFKRIDAPFRPGRNGQHFKYKFIKTLTAKILPKNAKDAAKGHNSIALGLLNSTGEWVEVGHASAIGKGELPLGALVEVKYLYGYGSKQAPHLVQARVEGLRDDLSDADCTITQVQFHQGQGQ